MYYHFLDQRDAKQEFWSDQNINLLTYLERGLLMEIKLGSGREKENSKLIQYQPNKMNLNLLNENIKRQIKNITPIHLKYLNNYKNWEKCIQFSFFNYN